MLAAEAGGGNGVLFIQLLASGALASVLAAVLNAVMSRRKLGAEATQIITDAASGVVMRLEQENAREHQANSDLRKDVTDLRCELRAYVSREYKRDEEIRLIVTTLQVHAAWDFAVMAALEKGDADFRRLRPPPPLLPPHLDLNDYAYDIDTEVKK